MSNYNSLKTTINANIKQNGNQEITGQILNSVLNQMVNTLGAGYQFMGVATPTNPGTAQTPDYKCFYLATTPGTYSHLGGLVVADGEVAILKYDTSWTKEVSGAATAAELSQLGQMLDDVVLGVKDNINNTFVVPGGYVDFDQPMHSGIKYTITLVSASALERVGFALVRGDGTTLESAFSINGVGNSVEYTPTEDFVKIRVGYVGQCSFSVSAAGIIQKIQEDLAELENDVPKKVDNRYENILDVKQIVDATGYVSSGNVMYNAGWSGVYGTIVLNWRGYEKITAFDIYASGGLYCVQFDQNGNFISGSAEEGFTGTHTFTRVSGAVSLGLTLNLRNGLTFLRASYGETLTDDTLMPNPIRGYINEINEVKTLFAYADGEPSSDDGTHFYGWSGNRCSIQRAIDSVKENAIIYCKGNFKVTSPNQFVLQQNNYYNVVFVPSSKNNIQLIGEGAEKTSIDVALADDFASYDVYQPMEIWGNNILVKGISISAKNCRYSIHMDASGGRQADNHIIRFEDMVLMHYRNAKSSFDSNLGLGISDGMRLYTERCQFIIDDDYTPSLYLHDNIKYNNGYVWIIKDCTFESNKAIDKTKAGKPFFSIQMLGGGVNGEVILENNDLCMDMPLIACENNNTASKTSLADYVANNFVTIKGHSELPFGYSTHNSTSAVLKITSKTTGANSSVRFDKTSSAFDILIKGSYKTDYTENTGVVHVDGYHYREGVDVLPGYAMGELALDTARICSMQNRLGDCSVNNKSLVVVIDGTSHTIVFNQNYTNYTDEQMLKVFNDVIGAVATIELYNWGADYFPEIVPLLTHKMNNTQEAILCGMGVHITSGGILKATTDAEVDAVAIEDIVPGYYGRVVKRGLFSIFKEDHHHVCLETYPQTENDKYLPAFQGYFGIGTTRGIFVKKETGPLYNDYWGYLTLR